jgi:hypothetical protein
MTGMVSVPFYDIVNIGFESILPLYEKKPECPVLCTGMNGQCWFGGASPQAFKAFSLEEAPTFGRGSSLRSLSPISEWILND